VEEAVVGNVALSFATSDHSSVVINHQQLKSDYRLWISSREGPHDFFLSYRWNVNFDFPFAGDIFDNFTRLAIGVESRQIRVFLDRNRLRDGDYLHDQLGTALADSLVVVPIISQQALAQMVNHDPNTVDNVLFEWILALECFEVQPKRVQRILPLYCLNDSQSALADSLPECHPAATLKKVHDQLQTLGVPPSEHFNEYTVKGVINQLKGILYKMVEPAIDAVPFIDLCYYLRGVLESVHPQSHPPSPSTHRDSPAGVQSFHTFPIPPLNQSSSPTASIFSAPVSHDPIPPSLLNSPPPSQEVFLQQLWSYISNPTHVQDSRAQELQAHIENLGLTSFEGLKVSTPEEIQEITLCLKPLYQRTLKMEAREVCTHVYFFG